MRDATTDFLLQSASDAIANARDGQTDALGALAFVADSLINVLRDQESRIAALEAGGSPQPAPPVFVRDHRYASPDSELARLFPGSGIVTQFRNQLWRVGLRTEAQIAATPDRHLLELSLIGPRAVALIRERVPYAGRQQP